MRAVIVGKRLMPETFCFYCGILLLTEPRPGYKIHPQRHTRDHVTPRSHGGADDAENLVDCCNACNTLKGARTLEQFRDYLQGRTLLPIVFFGEGNAEYKVCQAIKALNLNNFKTNKAKKLIKIHPPWIPNDPNRIKI